jgi:transposase
VGDGAPPYSRVERPRSPPIFETWKGWVIGPSGPTCASSANEQVDGGWLVSAIGEGDQWCLDCGERSKSRHRWHNRRLQDLPVQGERVALKLRFGS